MTIDLDYFDSYKCIIGCDEVGRGPIAGPVNACSVKITKEHQVLVKFLHQMGVTDSKKLSSKKRLSILAQLEIDLELLELNKVHSVKGRYGEFSFVITECSPIEIDQMNILQAALKCMQTASDYLIEPSSIVLVDGNRPFVSKGEKLQTIVQGDSKSSVISLASIIAKEYRDKLMQKFHEQFPGYDFHKNAGYPTQVHKEALINLGMTPIHRKTFKGVKELLEK